jgi:TolA-binding protein
MVNRTAQREHGFNRTGRQRCWAAGVLCLTAVGALVALHAQAPDAERSAWTGAVKMFQGGWYEQAEKELGAFTLSFPGSTNQPEAVLLQAQSRFQLKRYEGVISLLQPWLKPTGPRRDEYRYWTAQAESQLESYEAAAKDYADLLRDFPASSLRLEASYGEAWCRFKLGDTARTVDLLVGPGGAFQQAATGSTNEALLVRSNFLLAEALVAQKNFPAAAQTLTELSKRGLGPEAEWQRQFLLGRIEMGDRRTDAALQRATNLVRMATAQTNLLLQARSLTLMGEILEEKQPEAAAEAYENIARLPGVAPDQKRQALLKLVDLAVGQNRFTNAVQRLDTFLHDNPEDPALDLLRFSLGEIYLKQFYNLGTNSSGKNTPPPYSISTNLLSNARTQFDQLISQWINSAYLGKAQLNRGWCFWEEAQLPPPDAGKVVEAAKAFQAAVNSLPKSIEQAEALFKLGDCQFQLKNYSNALTNYRFLLNQYTDVPEARDKFLDHALYQTVRANLQTTNLTGAAAAVEQLLSDFPNSAWSDRGLFAYAQGLADAGSYAKAIEALADFQKRFPQSLLFAESRLAVARCYARQAEWTAAIESYDEWLKAFPTNDTRPQAEFDRAWCYYQAGHETNAFTLFTNLVQRFPASNSALLAELWLGDYYLNQRDPRYYGEAEKYYQLLFTSSNAVPAELSRRAILMAAKAAFFRQGYRDAKHYLTNYLVSDPLLRNDLEVGPETWFMLGDIEIMDPSRDLSTNKLAKYEDAILSFSRVTNFYSGSRLVPLAMGKIANCHFQLAAQNTNRYEMATNQYWQIINSPLADIATRSQAEFGLGQVLEKMAEQRTNRLDLLNTALVSYLNVVYGRRLGSGEEPDPFWMGKAALAAGALAERLQDFDQAERLYEYMQRGPVPVTPTWEKRLESLRLQRGK